MLPSCHEELVPRVVLCKLCHLSIAKQLLVEEVLQNRFLLKQRNNISQLQADVKILALSELADSSDQIAASSGNPFVW